MALTERYQVLKEVMEKWDSLYREAAWKGLPDDEVMWQFDQYLQKLTLPLRFNEKFPVQEERNTVKIGDSH